MRKLLTTIFISITLTSCFGLFDSGTDTIVDDYEVTWIDVHEHRFLSKKSTLVHAYIFAVGHDSKYIYAKQHPLLKNSKEKIDRKITNYYIIVRTKNEFQDIPVIGPLIKRTSIKNVRNLE